jgi:hypothetical protein
LLSPSFTSVSAFDSLWFFARTVSIHCVGPPVGSPQEISPHLLHHRHGNHETFWKCWNPRSLQKYIRQHCGLMLPLHVSKGNLWPLARSCWSSELNCIMCGCGSINSASTKSIFQRSQLAMHALIPKPCSLTCSCSTYTRNQLIWSESNLGLSVRFSLRRNPIKAPPRKSASDSRQIKYSATSWANIQWL